MFLVSFPFSLPGHTAPDRENEISDTKNPGEGLSYFFPKISDAPARFTEPFGAKRAISYTRRELG